VGKFQAVLQVFQGNQACERLRYDLTARKHIDKGALVSGSFFSRLAALCALTSLLAGPLTQLALGVDMVRVTAGGRNAMSSPVSRMISRWNGTHFITGKRQAHAEPSCNLAVNNVGSNTIVIIPSYHAIRSHYRLASHQ